MKEATARLRQSWGRGEATFGIWLAIPSQLSAELASVTECDYLCIDQQHGLVGYESMVSMLYAAGRSGPVPITRVPANDASHIALSLDAGACGVIVPMVNSAADAARAVAATRYPPKGIRSYGPIRGARVMGTKDPGELGAAALCVVMVETPEGLENVDEIAATEGVDAIYIGPSDLAVGLGLGPGLDQTAPDHAQAVERILDACKQAGIGAGIQCSNGKSARRYAAQGFTMLTVAKDSVALEAAFRQHLADAKDQSEVEEVAYL